MQFSYRFLWFLLIVLALYFPNSSIATVADTPRVYLVEIDDAIGPASQDLIIRAMKAAQQDKSPLIVLRLNTPGGLDFSMRKIIAAILDSEIPVATFVSPAGARAASAGTYIMYASHIAAMAPTTHLGAATPVQIGGIPEIPDLTGDKGDDQSESSDTKMEKKILNDAVAYIKGLAELHGRNGHWAELAVTDAKTLTSAEALDKNVIDLIATDVPQLLNLLEGKKINSGKVNTTISTSGAGIKTIQPDWRNRLLSIITDPNIAYILMLVGIYGLIFEFSNPGYVLPGVTGAICLILALYAFQVLPVSYAGVALVVVGLTFIIAEAFVTSGGVLGAGGLIAFVIGSIILFDDEHLAVSIPLIGGIAVVAGGFLLWVISRLASFRRRKVVSGAEAMLGKFGAVMEGFSGQGRVKFQGESWLATSTSQVSTGQKVRIVGVDGLVLAIEPLENSSKK